MSFQICLSCGDPFSGDDEDDECDACLMDKIDECEEKTGHKKTETVDGATSCKRCGVLLSQDV